MGLDCIRFASDGDDQGSVAAFVVGVLMALVLVAGLVVDGGLVLAARQRVDDQADEAARAGAQAMEETGAAAGRRPPLVDPGPGRVAASAYLARAGAEGSVAVRGDTVTVTVTARQESRVLGLVGIGSARVTGEASARAVFGLEGSNT